MTPTPEDLRAVDRAAALDRLTEALVDYHALYPPQPERTDPPTIEPKILHCPPSSFRRGYNMTCDAGGYMPGKILVVVVPCRLEDIRKYERCRTVRSLLAKLRIA